MKNIRHFRGNVYSHLNIEEKLI